IRKIVMELFLELRLVVDSLIQVTVLVEVVTKGLRQFRIATIRRGDSGQRALELVKLPRAVQAICERLHSDLATSIRFTDTPKRLVGPCVLHAPHVAKVGVLVHYLEPGPSGRLGITDSSQPSKVVPMALDLEVQRPDVPLLELNTSELIVRE